MSSDDLPTGPAERLRIALDLHEAGVAMMRARFRREHPDETDQQVEARVVAWLDHRPGAELGDAEGRGHLWPASRP